MQLKKCCAKDIFLTWPKFIEQHCLSAKQKPVESTHLMAFFNHLMLVRTKQHIHLNKIGSLLKVCLRRYDLLLPPVVKDLIGVLDIFKE